MDSGATLLLRNRLTAAEIAEEAVIRKVIADVVTHINGTTILDPALCAKWYEDLFDVIENN